MKILRLRFKNINSLKGENFIDFTTEPLSETGIFAIIGPTGSGKSSILDAITLALYNRTPRSGTQLSKTEISDLGSIITQNTDECFAEVDYNINGNEYRSKWMLKRARTGNLRDHEMELAKLPSQQLYDLKKSQVPKKNEEIIGLNYEQFVKSVLLSQGEFSKFLKAKADERGDLLEKITGTEIYRKIGRAAFERWKIEKENLVRKEDALEHFRLLDEEEIETLSSRSENFKAKVAKLEPEIKQLNLQYQIKLTLDKISGEITVIEKEKDNLADAAQKFEKEAEKLKIHKKLLSIKTEISNHTQLSDKKNELCKNIDKAQNEIEILEKNHSTANEKLISDKKLFESKNIEFENLKPVIKEVKVIDNDISMLQSKVDDEKSTYENLKNESVLYQKRRDKLIKQSEKEKAEKETLTIWLQKNVQVSQLDKEIPLIGSMISNLTNQAKHAKKLITESGKSSLLTKEMDWNAILDKNKASKGQISEKAGSLEQTLIYTTKELEKLEKDRESKRQAYTEIEKLIEISASHAEKQSKINNAKQIVDKKQQEVQVFVKTIEAYKKQIEIAEMHIKELQIQKERRELEKSLDKHREKLRENEACPLCGSVHHPFVKEYKQLLDKTLEMLKKQEKTAKELQEKLRESENKYVKISTEIKNENEKIIVLTGECDDLIARFDKKCTKNDFRLDINKATEIETLKNLIIEEGKHLKENIDMLRSLIKLNDEIKDLKIIEDKITDVCLAEKKLIERLDIYKNYTNENHDYNKRFEALKKMSEQYKNSTERHSTLENSLGKLEIQLSENRTHESKLKERLSLLNERLTNLKAKLDSLKSKRNALMDDRNPEVVEKTFNDEIRDLTNKIHKTENQIAKIATQTEGEKKQLDTLQNEKIRTETAFAQIIRFLEPEIEKLGFDNIDTARQHILSNEEAENINKKKKLIEEKRISITQSLKDKRNAFDETKAKENIEGSPIKIAETIDKIEKEIAGFNQEIGIIKNKIEDDQKARNDWQKAQYELNIVKKEYEKWGRLNTLIGDAEGKKFSRFAQELTLLQLIAKANQHLRMLNDRYIIKKSGKKSREDIVVVDKYLGNSERAVQTLSGGESFLASLALALGLSDLAGQNTRIESLFIDEGFGSLDQQALDLALDALEKLQNETKRTIGVISHVQALKDRITTQIELKRIGTGYSTIEIRN